jgi:hypothetical protein
MVVVAMTQEERTREIKHSVHPFFHDDLNSGAYIV